MVRKYLLLLRARPLSEQFTYFNFVWRAPSEFFLISVSVFKSFPLLSLGWTRWYVRPVSRQEKWQIQGLLWHWSLSTVYMPWLNDRISWRGWSRNMIWIFVPVRLLGTSSRLPLLCPFCLWSYLFLDSETITISRATPLRTTGLFVCIQACCLAVFVGVPVNGYNILEGMLQEPGSFTLKTSGGLTWCAWQTTTKKCFFIDANSGFLLILSHYPCHFSSKWWCL